MAITLEPAAAPARALSPRARLLAIAGIASIGAGAIHAAAVGLHVAHRPAALAFTALAVLQIGWGVWACLRSDRFVMASGLGLGAAAIGGFAMAKTTGISFVAGLEAIEPVQTVDALAAGLATAAVLLIGVALMPATSAVAASTTSDSRRPRFATSFAATTVAIVAVFGMVSASANVHEHGPGGLGDGHDETVAAGAGGADSHADGHGDHAAASAVPAGMATPDPSQEHKPTVIVPYDPAKPLDFGGVPGVTPEQQARAENVVAVTLIGLPQWADYKHAEANGYKSIGDGLTGTEHFVHLEYMADDIFLDPNKPESLVYDTKRDGTKVLAAAMYMVKAGTPLNEVPDIGGALTQWHIHNNLCYRPDGKLGGLTNAEGKCAPGLILPTPAPMIHVWIRKHPCGPFAALEGIGGGTIAEGETKLCDEAHGSH